MRLIATTGILMACLALAPVASAQYEIQQVNTGYLFTQFSTNGLVGDDCAFVGLGFSISGEETLCGGGILVGFSPEQVLGGAYDPVSQNTGFDHVGLSSATSPYPDFDMAALLEYDDNRGIGLSVDQLVSWQTSGALTDAIIIDYTFTNTSGGEIAFYPGMFMDWDQGDYQQGVGTAEPDDSRIFTYDGSGLSQAVAGQVILNSGLHGWRHFTSYESIATGGILDPAVVYGYMTTQDELIVEACAACPAPDIRTTLSADQVTLAAGESKTVSIAIVGTLGDADDWRARADAIQDYYDTNVAIEPGPDGTPGTHALTVGPNPFSARTTLTLEVAQTQPVRVAVYDALGREVAVLHDGALSAGTPHRLALDASALPSGVYLVRVAGEQFTATKTVTLNR